MITMAEVPQVRSYSSVTSIDDLPPGHRVIHHMGDTVNSGATQFIKDTWSVHAPASAEAKANGDYDMPRVSNRYYTRRALEHAISTGEGWSNPHGPIVPHKTATNAEDIKNARPPGGW